MDDNYYQKFKEENIILRIYCLSYNVLRIMGGMAGLAFN